MILITCNLLTQNVFICNPDQRAPSTNMHLANESVYHMGWVNQDQTYIRVFKNLIPHSNNLPQSCG